MTAPAALIAAAVALAVGAAAGWAAHAALPRYGEPAAVNAVRVTAPTAAARVPTERLGDLAAAVCRILTDHPQGPATDTAALDAVRAVLAVDDRAARDVVVTIWAEACPFTPAPFGSP